MRGAKKLYILRSVPCALPHLPRDRRLLRDKGAAAAPLTEVERRSHQVSHGAFCNSMLKREAAVVTLTGIKTDVVVLGPFRRMCDS
jgi:hypothetical protein